MWWWTATRTIARSSYRSNQYINQFLLAFRSQSKEEKKNYAHFQETITNSNSIETYLNASFDDLDYENLDFVNLTAFHRYHQHSVLELLSSSSCISIVDFETKFSPAEEQVENKRDESRAAWPVEHFQSLIFFFLRFIVEPKTEYTVVTAPLLYAIMHYVISLVQCSMHTWDRQRQWEEKKKTFRAKKKYLLQGLVFFIFYFTHAQNPMHFSCIHSPSTALRLHYVTVCCE